VVEVVKALEAPLSDSSCRQEGNAMKNIGIIAIVAGILVIILGLAGVLGQGGNVRTVMVGAVILLAVGFLLYRRGQSGRPS
jgi:Flp pilus assembly protein TadB